MPTNTNYLALDVGGRRIGVALASEIARLPSPLITIENNDEVFVTIRNIVEKEEVGLLVVGYPRNLQGQSTEQTRVIEDFVQDLKSHIDVETIYQDEALTSRYAKEELESRGRPYSKGDVDSLAATYILQDYLSENSGR